MRITPPQKLSRAYFVGAATYYDNRNQQVVMSSVDAVKGYELTLTDKWLCVVHVENPEHAVYVPVSSLMSVEAFSYKEGKAYDTLDKEAAAAAKK